MTSAVVPPLFQGVAKDSAGYKLLAAMGWREGEGLVRVAGCLRCAAVSTTGGDGW